MIQKREDDYQSRRIHLKNFDDEGLKDYFWTLVDRLVEPLVELATTHTTPAIERSVLLRMGFSSIEAKSLVEKTISHDLISKGAGHVVYRYSLITGLPIRDTGLLLLNDVGWDQVVLSFSR
jgi:D-ornithine 4,5-aminomutase subunit alpha